MAKLTEFLTGIADAIRAKKGTTDPIPADNFADEIASIETGRDPVLEALEVAENGEYIPGEEVDGFSKVTVQVEPALSELEVMENGVYVPDEGVYGFSEVTVQVEPVLTALEATENGVYVPNEDVDGFSEVTVQVEPVLSALEVTENGVYAPEEGTDGFSEVTVNVEQGVFLPELANPAAAEDIVLGKEVIDQNGEKVAGTMPENAAEIVLLDATTPLYQIPAGKHTGEGTVGIELEEVTVVLSDEQQEITPTAGKVLGKVIVPAGGGGDEFFITDASYLFYSGVRLDVVSDLLKLVKSPTSMRSMFASASITDSSVLDFRGLDTSKVVSFAETFSKAVSTTTDKHTIDISGFDFSSATDLSKMFSGISYGGERLNIIWPEVLNTGKVTTISGIFNAADLFSGVAQEFIDKFDTSSLKDMSNSPFSGVQDEELDLSRFDTQTVTNMSSAFGYLSKVKKLICPRNTEKASNMSSVFQYSTSLEEIIGFSAMNRAGFSIGFPYGKATSRNKLKRLTFCTDLPEGACAIRSAISIQYCSFDRNGMVEMFNTLPDVSEMTHSASYKKITITGNPCVLSEVVLNEVSAGRVTTLEALLDAAAARYFGFDYTNAPIRLLPAAGTGGIVTTIGELDEETLKSWYSVRFLADTIIIPEEMRLTDEDRAIATNKGWTLVE